MNELLRSFVVERMYVFRFYVFCCVIGYFFFFFMVCIGSGGEGVKIFVKEIIIMEVVIGDGL